jgi:hypothetical protein
MSTSSCDSAQTMVAKLDSAMSRRYLSDPRVPDCDTHPAFRGGVHVEGMNSNFDRYIQLLGSRH